MYKIEELPQAMAKIEATDIRDVARYQLAVMDEQIEGRSWNQSLWVSECGTQACFIGNIVLAAGFELKVEPPSTIIDTDGLKVGLLPIARRILGIPGNFDVINYLYESVRTDAEIRSICHFIIDMGYVPSYQALRKFSMNLRMQ